MKSTARKSPRRQGLTITEAVIAIVIVAGLACLAAAYVLNRTMEESPSKSINNARQIALSCRLYAQDNNGAFPAGTEPRSSPANANTILQDLFSTGEIKLEALFWNPRATHVCAPNPPNENGILEPGENAFDYVSGLTDSSRNGLPLLVEAQTSPHSWDHREGHPRKRGVVVAYADASTAVLAPKRRTGGIHVWLPTGEVHLLSVTDEAGTIPGNLPPEAIVKRAAPAPAPGMSDLLLKN